jgi:hypothetical protein
VLRLVAHGERLLRLVLAAGADEAELERGLDALRRRKGELRLAPSLPDGWMEIGLRRLRVGPTTVDLRLRRRVECTVVLVRRAAGPAVRSRIGLPGRTRRGPVTVDQTELGGAEVTFTLEDVHEVAFHDE